MTLKVLVGQLRLVLDDQKMKVFAIVDVIGISYDSWVEKSCLHDGCRICFQLIIIVKGWQLVTIIWSHLIAIRKRFSEWNIDKLLYSAEQVKQWVIQSEPVPKMAKVSLLAIKVAATVFFWYARTIIKYLQLGNTIKSEYYAN